MAVISDFRDYISYDLFKILGNIPDNNDEALIKAIIKSVSRRIEDYCNGVHFIPVTETRTFDFYNGYVLWLDKHLCYLTTLTNNGSAIASGDILEYPPSEPWTRRIEISRSSSSFFTWSDQPEQCTTVLGRWAYSEDYEDTGAALNAAISSATATTFQSTPTTADIEEGWCALVGDEQMYVKDVTGTDGYNTVTVVRGVNGTDAATHSISTVIYRYVVPRDVEHACYVLTQRWLIRGQASWADRTGSPEAGYTMYGIMPAEVRAILDRYKWEVPWW